MKKPSRILIADQDEKSRNYLETALSSSGYNIGSTGVGQELLDMIHDTGAALCIIDPLLPDIDGFSLSRSIADNHPEIGILISTSNKMDKHSKQEARTRYGARDFLIKPYDRQTLLETVEAQISGKTPPPSKSQKDAELSKELDEMLENTLSGIDLFPAKKKKKAKGPATAAVFSTTKPKKPATVGATMRVSPEDLKREMARIKDELKSEPRPKVKKDAGVFTSSDIFGALIEDIETGKVSESEFTLPGKNRSTEEVRSDTDADIFGTQPLPPLELIEEDEIDLDETNNRTSAANEYQFLEKIASGGMAEVWKAKLVGEQGFEKIVAIKKILPHLSANEDFLTMFTDEAKVAAKLTHPNIAQIYELRTSGKQAFIAMEYVSGHTLRNILNQCKKLKITMPCDIVFYIGMKLCNALYYAHNKKDFDNQDLNIVHRDVSPQNIIISGEGEIKLVDFGIAKASIKATETVAGSLKGKLLYMSPEQGDGKILDHRSDIFSLGCVLYEALTGARLFSGNSELAILKNVREALYPKPREVNPSIPDEAQDILLKVLAKEPGDRFESARACENRFKEFLRDSKYHINESDVADFMRFLFESNLEKLKAMGVQQAPVPAEKEPKPTPEPLPEAPSFNSLAPPIEETPQKPKPPERPAVAAPPIEAPPRRARITQPAGRAPAPDKKSNKLLFAIIFMIILAVGGGAWYFFKGADKTVDPPISSEKVNTESPSLPDPEPKTPENAQLPDDKNPPVEGVEQNTGQLPPAEPAAAEGEKKTDEEMEKLEEAVRKRKEELEKLKKKQSPAPS